MIPASCGIITCRELESNSDNNNTGFNRLSRNEFPSCSWGWGTESGREKERGLERQKRKSTSGGRSKVKETD